MQKMYLISQDKFGILTLLLQLGDKPTVAIN